MGVLRAQIQQPHVRASFVRLNVGFAQDIRDIATVRRDLRIAESFQANEIFHGEGCRRGEAAQAHGRQGKQEHRGPPCPAATKYRQAMNGHGQPRNPMRLGIVPTQPTSQVGGPCGPYRCAGRCAGSVSRLRWSGAVAVRSGRPAPTPAAQGPRVPWPHTTAPSRKHERRKS